tara:strand:+ start:250 stop:528 length:279 start_codon:yes stop_codon:yes gene_type:complete
VATLSLADRKLPVKDHLKTLNTQQLPQMLRRKDIVVKDVKVKTTPELVGESNMALFRATMNLPNAAKHCGMTEREMKMTFREFLKSHPPENL